MKHSASQENGSTLAIVITIMAILIAVVGVAIDYTTNETRNVQRSMTFQNALVLGDNALEVLFNNWRSTCRGAPSTVFKTSDFSAVATPSPFPGVSATNFVKRGTGFDPMSDSDYDSNYTISNYKVIGVSAEYTAVASAAATPEPALGQLSGNVSSITPTTSASYNYVASADVTLPTAFGSGSRGKVVAKVRRVFSKQQLSPWNWAIFYVDPLEIHPGPLFTVTGWVHTNSDLYTGHNTLTFADKVTYASDWFVGFKPGDAQHPETPQSPSYPGKLPPARDQALQPFGLDSSSIFSSTDTNPNNDSYAELIQPPVAGYTDPLASARYWNQAGAAIKIDASNNVTIGTTNTDGTITSLGPPASGPDSRTAAQKALYNMFNGAITTNQSIQDNREGTSIRLATLDVGQITTSDGGTGNRVKFKASNFNGVVYIYDSSNTTSTRRGIRIKNGSKIPFNQSSGASGLTIASNNPVYIQGDFNTGGTGSAVPSNDPSNLNADGTYPDPNNPPNPQVDNYTRAPTSILADAVTILSNSWVDANAGTVPVASPTTINTAIVAGIVPTNTYGDGAYSGGAENFPRFLENWANDTFTYYGSMVELYKSQQSVGEWGKANVYSPPAREWFFDTNFRITPPPGTLMLTSYTKGLWSLQ